MENNTTVGVLVRVDPDGREAVAERLRALDGVSVFDVQRPDSVGVLIEAPDLDAAHATLRGDLQSSEGVLAAWPVHVHVGSEAPVS